MIPQKIKKKIKFSRTKFPKVLWIETKPKKHNLQVKIHRNRRKTTSKVKKNHFETLKKLMFFFKLTV